MSVAPCDQTRTEKVSLGSLEGSYLGIGKVGIFHVIYGHNWATRSKKSDPLGLGKGTVLCCASFWWLVGAGGVVSQLGWVQGW